MACPLCGEQCRCSYPAPKGAGEAVSLGEGRTSVLIDPETYDPTEEQFAASIYHEEEPLAPPAPAETVASENSAPSAWETTLTGIERLATEVIDKTEFAGSGEGWRDEVHSRLNSYRAKRRRGRPEGAMPLDFGGEELSPQPATRRSAAVNAVATRYANRPPMMSAAELEEAEEEAPLPENNIIVFPKPPEPAPTKVYSFERTQPLPLSDELAEAVQESPRILDAPAPEELAPVMPEVTAIALEGEADVPDTSAPALELPLRAAPIGQRVFAGMVDLSAVVVASATFALVFVKIAGGMPQSKIAPAIFAGVAGLLWALYQYMFLVYAGTTPGLQVSGLALRDFKGRHMERVARRNRAIGMVVAALPIGLGFLWAFLDQDMLCWQDRISHSYVVERGH